MGKNISEDYHERPLLAVVVLRGAFVFASDLVREMDPGLDIHIDFARASSYGDHTVSSGQVELDGPDPALVAGRDVLLIEDIIDTGRTLLELTRHVRSLAPRSVEIAALLLKDRGMPPPGKTARYLGFTIPDVFVVGYGLDYAQGYRHLSDIRILETR